MSSPNTSSLPPIEWRVRELFNVESTWIFLLFSVISLGAYQVIWMKRQTDQIAIILNKSKINPIYWKLFIPLYFGATFISNTMQEMKNSRIYYDIEGMLSVLLLGLWVGSLVILILFSIEMRKSLLTISRKLAPEVAINPILSVIPGPIYLNYKMREIQEAVYNPQPQNESPFRS